MSRRARSSLLIRIDLRARGTLQQQIYREIRRAILSGVLAPGARIPSTRSLAGELGVSRTTTLLALEQLLAEGYLTPLRGSGTYVAHELPDDLPDLQGTRTAPDPESSAPAPPLVRHPPLSRRGTALAATPPASVRVGGPPRAFRIGTPGLDLFPIRLWGQLLQRRLRTVSPMLLDYGESAGLLELRQGIAEQVSRSRGTRCTAEQVIVTAGAQRALDLIARVLLDPDDTVWMEEPGYPGAHNAFVAAGLKIRQIRVDEEGMDIEGAARRGEPARMVYLSPSHQFPLGVPMSLPRRLALLRWASAERAWVIEDDYDSEFRYGARAIPCLHGLDNDDRVIYVGTFAKTLFPALRLGFLIVPPDLRGRIVAARRASDLHPPALDQAVLADFIDGGHYERHLRRMRSAYGERLEALRTAMERWCGGALTLRPVQTGLHGIADLDESTGASAERVFDEAAARGVEVMPLSAYYFRRKRPGEKQKPPNALLLGFASVRPAALRRGMEQLAAAIEAASQRS